MNEDEFDEDDDTITMPEPLTHVGVRSERTIWDSGDLERAFAFAWLEKHQLWGDGHLQQILSNGGPEGDAVVTQRDATVAATIIQWLGTPCGWCWFCEVLRKHGQYKIIDTYSEKRLNELLKRPYGRRSSDA